MKRFKVSISLLSLVILSVGCLSENNRETMSISPDAFINSGVISSEEPTSNSELVLDDNHAIEDLASQTPTVEKPLPCFKQPAITEDMLVKRNSETKTETRKQNFQDAGDIEIQIKDMFLEPIQGMENNMIIKIQINTYFRNNIGEPLVLYIPPGASNNFGTMGLFINIIDSDDNNIIDLDANSFDVIYPTITNFVTIPAGAFHCETYELTWLVSEDGIVLDNSGNIVQVWNYIPSGRYQIRAEYHNYAVGYDDFDANPFIGTMVSKWIEFQIP